MTRLGKSYMQLANQWRRITDELERRSGGVEFTITGDRNIALYERATDAVGRYTRNIEHTPEGHRACAGEQFLDKVFPCSVYMGAAIEEQQPRSVPMEKADVYKKAFPETITSSLHAGLEKSGVPIVHPPQLSEWERRIQSTSLTLPSSGFKASVIKHQDGSYALHASFDGRDLPDRLVNRRDGYLYQKMPDGPDKELRLSALAARIYGPYPNSPPSKSKKQSHRRSV